MVAVRKSNPTRTAVFLVDAVVGAPCWMIRSLTVGSGSPSGALDIGFTFALSPHGGTTHHREPSSPNHEPQRQQELADERERRDIDPRAIREQRSDRVDHVAETGNGEKNAQEPGDVARAVREIADDEQVDTEQEEAGRPDVAEIVYPRERLDLQLVPAEHGKIVVATEQTQHSDQLADRNQVHRNQVHRCVDEPEPRREHRDAPARGTEHPVQRPRDDDVERDHSPASPAAPGRRSSRSRPVQR
jgi:hypothetical protein